MSLSALKTLQLGPLGPFAPPTGPWGAAIAGFQCFIIATAGLNEVYNPTQYSKFNDGDENQLKQITTRKGMFLLYAPSVVVAAGCMATQAKPTLAAPLLAVHFGKRVLEVLFLHKYSGTMGLKEACGISTYYSLVTALIAKTALAKNPNSKTQAVGLAAFVVGELGNLYHHYLLRCLRTRSDKASSGDGEKRYVPPAGGLFSLVAAPHYLFEITAFLGIAGAAQSTHALLAALGMASYLAGRAVLTNKFYQERFDESQWPSSRKAILPFLF